MGVVFAILVSIFLLSRLEVIAMPCFVLAIMMFVLGFKPEDAKWTLPDDTAFT
jgi:hypothetical protein